MFTEASSAFKKSWRGKRMIVRKAWGHLCHFRNAAWLKVVIMHLRMLHVLLQPRLATTFSAFIQSRSWPDVNSVELNVDRMCVEVGEGECGWRTFEWQHLHLRLLLLSSVHCTWTDASTDASHLDICQTGPLVGLMSLKLTFSCDMCQRQSKWFKMILANWPHILLWVHWSCAGIGQACVSDSHGLWTWSGFITRNMEHSHGMKPVLTRITSDRSTCVPLLNIRAQNQGPDSFMLCSGLPNWCQRVLSCSWLWAFISMEIDKKGGKYPCLP